MKHNALFLTILALFTLAGGAIAAAAASLPPLPGFTAEDRIRHAAEAAAVHYVVMAPSVEADTVVSDRVRSITVNDRGRRCVVEVTYSGMIDSKTKADRSLPSGWLVSNASCAPGEVTFVPK